MKRATRVFFMLVLLAVLVYTGDWGYFRFKGSPKRVVQISKFVEAPLKNEKEELDFTGQEDRVCSVSWFPQVDFAKNEMMPPCWYLLKHTNEVTTY
jgi:hypothetical protein